MPGRRFSGRKADDEGVDAMGRGRAKAKQTKVARELKYRSLDTDLDALRAELTGGSADSLATASDDIDDLDEDDDEDSYEAR
jgi:hypothetical protein